MQRDRIDFGSMNIPVLFRKIFFPTLLGRFVWRVSRSPTVYS